MDTQDFNVRVSALDYSCVFADRFDDGQLWLSIQTQCASANCILKVQEAKQLVQAMQQIINHETEVLDVHN